jgi:heterodisulfide reductase subunit B
LEDVGPEALGAHVVRPLAGLRVAPYLGCLVSRPDLDGRYRSHEGPRDLDRVLAALGAEVVDFPLRTACCGGHMTQISPAMGLELIRRIVDAAERLDADVLATVCPMCQMNIDAFQGEMNRHFGTDHAMPILFFTQLVGLAFGEAPDALGIDRCIVSARRALHRIDIEVAAPEASEEAATPARRAKRPSGLPMPSMPGNEEPST